MRFIALIAVSVAASSAAAQRAPSLRGDVVLGDSVTPAVGVIVDVLDSSGTVLARTLTGTSGTFVAALPNPGRFGVQVRRIGFRPTSVPFFDVGADAPTILHIVLGMEAVRLPEVNKRTGDVCHMSPDSGMPIVQVWEQARQALSATQIRSTDAPPDVQVLRYQRVVDTTGRRILIDSAMVHSTLAAHGFESAPADSFAARGYSRTSRYITYWFGPDANTLVSDQFAANHCFALLPATAVWPGSVGLAFRPARDRGGIVDIKGTFWLDRATGELQVLEFSYTGLPWNRAVSWAGGREEFIRLADGTWLLNRWHIRFPSDTVVEYHSRTSVASRAIAVVGGEVTAAAKGGRDLYTSTAVAVDAVIAPSRDSPLGPDSVEVEIPGPGYFGVGDGLVHFAHLHPGEYRALVTTADMRAAGLPAVPRKFVVPGQPGAVRDTLALPTGDELLLDACGEKAVRRGDAFVAGSLVDERGNTLEGEWVKLRWREGVESAAELQLSGGHEYTAVTDSHGSWVACGVPRGVGVLIRAADPTGTDGPRFVKLGARDALAVVRLRSWRPR